MGLRAVHCIYVRVLREKERERRHKGGVGKEYNNGDGDDDAG